MSAGSVQTFEPSLAVVGATGIVGQEIVSVLGDEDAPIGPIQLSASDDSAGEVYEFKGKELEVVSPEALKVEHNTLVVLCAPRDTSEKLLEQFRKKSLAVIDCSGLDRLQFDLAIMPEALNHSTQGAAYSVKTPAGFMLIAFLSALQLEEKVKLLVANSLESVSGAGRSGLDELWSQTRAVFNQSTAESEFFPEQIAFNILPRVDVMREDGVTAYEARVASELRSAQFAPDYLHVSAVRVPIMYGTAISLSMEVCVALSADEINSRLSQSQRFSVSALHDEPSSTLTAVGDERIHVGRLMAHKLDSGNTKISCWMSADNVKACIARPVVDLYRSLMPSM